MMMQNMMRNWKLNAKCRQVLKKTNDVEDEEDEEEEIEHNQEQNESALRPTKAKKRKITI